MNSLVLKPWRWVVFLEVIPGTAPCSGLFRPSDLATGATRRAVPREACEVRRTGPAAGFLARRLTPEAPSLHFLRIFPATAFACLRHAPTRVYMVSVPTNNAPHGEHSGTNPCYRPYSTFWVRIKALSHCKKPVSGLIGRENR